MRASEKAGRRDRGLLVAVALILATLLGWQNGLGRLDQALYDTLAMLLAPDAAPDIVIVAIDETSLAGQGRWPWPRERHADLIERISAGAPAAIGLDLLLPEPSADARSDQALARALARSGKVALPVFAGAREGSGVRAVPPIAGLADAAAALGQVSILPDDDGVVREVFLRGGIDGEAWDHLSVELLRLADRAPATLPGERAPSRDAPTPGVWWQDRALRIAYPAGRSHAHVSAHAVLTGEVDPAMFADRIVLIGITAAGLGDTYPTPVTGDGQYAPGVEVLAATVDNVAHGPHWRSASPLQTVLATVFAVCLVLLVLFQHSPAGALVGTVLFSAAILGASLLLLAIAGLWLPPGAALVVLFVAYPLWSWRRLEAASAYMANELRRLQREDLILPYPRDEPVRGGDLVDQRINAMSRATSHLRALNAFIEASIDSLPDITLVTDRDGRIVLANQAAAAYFEHGSSVRMRGAPLARLLGNLQARAGGPPDIVPGLDVECQDPHRREFLLKVSECRGLPDFATIGIVSLIDVGRLRQAERARDEALRFLSHDLRAPLSAIQAIVALPPDGPDAGEREARIGRLAAQAQGLAEAFVQLARAESGPLRRDLLDLADVVMDAVDACWAQAQGRGVRLVFAPPDAAPGCGDRDMLTRVVVNLLTNAIKYGPPDADVVITLQQDAGDWRLSVRDQGPGIAPPDQAELFDPFVRVNRNAAAGIGLGLAFVRATVTRLGGEVSVQSAPGEGSTFTLRLPGAPSRR